MLTTAALSEARRGPYRQGDVVPIRGQVLDRQGAPVEGIDVVLEMSRTSFSLRRMKSETGDTLRLPARTDASGRFTIDWSWDPHFTDHALAVGVEIWRGDKPDFEVLTRRDISAEIGSGQPINIALKVDKADYLRWLKGYVAGKASEDEIRVFRDAGRPDRIEPGVHQDESSWWYFAAGKVYRFQAGRLAETSRFEPVQPSS